MVSKEWLKRLRKEAVSKIHDFGEMIGDLEDEDIRTLVHELKVHQIELELQNKELVAHQELIEAEKAKFTQLFNHAPIGYIVVNELGLIQQFNTAFCNMIEDDLLPNKTSIFDVLEPEDAKAFRARFKAIIKSSINKQFEARLKTSKISFAYVLINTLFQTRQNQNELLLTITDISTQKKNEQLLDKAVKEKDVLLKELHHRTKNNMQMISSLINLKLNSPEYKNSKGLLKDISNRIRSISIVHEKLCQSKDLTQVSMVEYFDEIITLSMIGLKGPSQEIEVNKEIDDTVLDIDSAIACGLILNELLTNAVKYAFPQGKSGSVDITFSCDSKRKIQFSVKDDGIGLPDNLDIHQSKSLGFFIIKSMVECQLSGRINVIRANGTMVLIEFRAK